MAIVRKELLVIDQAAAINRQQASVGPGLCPGHPYRAALIRPSRFNHITNFLRSCHVGNNTQLAVKVFHGAGAHGDSYKKQFAYAIF